MQPLDDCFQRYEQVATALADNHRELALVLVAELEARSNAWVNQDSDSVTVRDRFATHAALAFSTDKFKLQAEIAALEAERDYLKVLIARG